MVELPSLIALPGVFFQCYLIILPCTLFWGLYCPGTHGASMGSPLAFLMGQLCSDQISFGPLPHPKIHHIVNIGGIPTNAKDLTDL